MKLGTFEIRTAVGAEQRLGALTEAGIVDLNFACGWLLAKKGEPRPHKLAGVVLPDNMLEYLEEGITASCYASEVLAALEPGATGIRGETLLYAPSEVRLLAPLPNPPSLRDFYASKIT
jgi:hypothetical protein